MFTVLLDCSGFDSRVVVAVIHPRKMYRPIQTLIKQLLVTFTLIQSFIAQYLFFKHILSLSAIKKVECIVIKVTDCGWP